MSGVFPKCAAKHSSESLDSWLRRTGRVIRPEFRDKPATVPRKPTKAERVLSDAIERIEQAFRDLETDGIRVEEFEAATGLPDSLIRKALRTAQGGKRFRDDGERGWFRVWT